MKLTRVQCLEGQLRLPGDKSISHRAALIAALASGTSTLSNFSTALDCASTLSCLEQLGIQISRSNTEVIIEGGTGQTKPTRPLDCGNSGSTMRILAGVLASQNFTSELTGDSSLNSRPMKRIIDPLELMGAEISSIDGKPPLTVRGSSRLKPISYKLPVASAQVKSAILFAALGTEGRTQVIESSLSRDHTERLFNGFGVNVSSEDLTVSIDGPAQLVGGDITIPGDISSAAYFIAAAMLLPESNLVIDAVGLNPTRAEFLTAFRSWGANISTENIQSERNEPVGTVVVKGGLRSGSIPATDRRIDGARIPAVIDELPLLAVVGSQIPEGIEIRDAGELRHKESDRLKATAINLRKMGAEVEEYEDGLFVNGPTKLHSASLDSFGDHRIAMAFSVAALLADGPTEIFGAECVDISFPEFFKLLHALRIV